MDKSLPQPGNASASTPGPKAGAGRQKVREARLAAHGEAVLSLRVVSPEGTVVQEAAAGVGDQNLKRSLGSKQGKLMQGGNKLQCALT